VQNSVCDFDHTCDEGQERRDDLFIECRGSASDASRLRRDLARILLSDATRIVVMFSSLIARHLF
jgi:hypothetical protein